MARGEYNIRKDLQDFITVGAIKAFAKKNNIDYGGVKANVIRNIILAVTEGELEENVVKQFLNEQLWYGKHKHIFFVEVEEGETIKDFKYTETLLKYFNDIGIQPFNNLSSVDLPEGISLARFEYEVNPHNDLMVDKLFLGFVEKNYTYFFHEQTPVFRPVNTYICIEIDLVRNVLILRTRSQKKLKVEEDISATNVTTNLLAKKYLDYFQQEYGFEYLDGASEEIKNTMYNIEKELTSFIELQFQPKVREHEKLIREFTVDVSSRLGLSDDCTPIDLPGRIFGLLERALIVENEEIIEEYQEGKIGYVNMFDFKDDKGGRINARSKHKSIPIQTSDIFFDTRETINEVKLLDNLWVA